MGCRKKDKIKCSVVIADYNDGGKMLHVDIVLSFALIKTTFIGKWKNLVFNFSLLEVPYDGPLVLKGTITIT